ncbi:UNVERIFIED_CONTAM: putative glucan 1,3-beta-glucosidase A [Sesamum latifolium]|uniref:Glucan 1,3-beta-glucosidase A n=1 Tax=Sesamum latifolium TaxID=2727402 RepID=A0AAW2WEF7_9LAMI
MVLRQYSSFARPHKILPNLFLLSTPAQSMKHLVAFGFWLWLFCVAITKSFGQNPPYKAVNLGGWLVVEGWMKPSLFDAIPNKDLLDGTQVQLKSTSLNMYLCAENGGGSALVANRPTASGWETFRLWRINESTFNFRVHNRDFIGVGSSDQGKSAFARTTEAGDDETFVIVRNNENPLRVRIRCSNGLYLQAVSGDSVRGDYGGSDDWSDQNPSVFQMSIVGTLQGEFQLTNAYGPDKAPSVMKNHWDTYIIADDFRFMSENGLTAVRIPVGWWIMQHPNPPKPFVWGSLQALDNAFTWADNYNMKVILDLHAVPGSQSGNHHSGTRDGFLEWGDSRILETVSVIDFLAARYADHPSLIAIELMNEPLAPGVTLDCLRKYYKAGYDAVRAYTSTAYVILSNRLGEANHTELLPFAAGLNYSVIDVHYYNRYSDYFRSLNGQQNVDYVYKKRPKQLQEVTHPGGPLSFVGEWTADLYINNSSMQDYQRFTKAQLDVYGKATFGWAYWSYKCEQKHWSFRWMIENGYMKL